MNIYVHFTFAPCGLTYRYKRTNEIFAELEIYSQTNIKILQFETTSLLQLIKNSLPNMIIHNNT